MRILSADFPRIGLDLGTSSIRGVAWHPDGSLLATAERAAPPLHRWRGLEVQDPRQLLARAAEVLALLDSALGPDAAAPRVAFTAQRDTLLLVSSREREGSGAPTPRTPLLSWRERRYLEDPALRQALLAGDGRALSLEEWVLASWETGRDGALRFAGGDKNCEYLAMGVRPGAPGVGGVSLGSAISLGMATGGDRPPEPPPGIVVTPMAGGLPGWNLETGVLSGMGGRQLSAELAGVDPWPGELPGPTFPGGAGRGAGIRLLPHFGGALDDRGASPELQTSDGSPLDPDTGRAGGILTPDRVARAWAEGVARELARLRPRLEQLAGSRLAELRLAGGGARDPAWVPILEEALEVPVTKVGDGFAGCRGAVLAAGWG